MPKILVAEDVPEILFAYETILSAAGYEVVASNNGQEASEHLQKTQFDLVLTDLLMPDGDGIFLATSIRKLSHRPKVLVITGGGDRISVHEALKISDGFFDATLVKPVKPALMLKTIDRLLKGLPQDAA
jgi:CheY-like chemotaxis protein